MKIASGHEFSLTIGSAVLKLPKARELPPSFMGAVLWARFADAHGYDEIARKEADRILAWLSRPAGDADGLCDRATKRAPPERVDALLASGMDAGRVAAQLGLQKSYVLERAKMVRLDVSGESVDVTTPKYAFNETFCAEVLSLGGYPAIDFHRHQYVGPGGGMWQA